MAEKSGKAARLIYSLAKKGKPLLSKLLPKSFLERLKQKAFVKGLENVHRSTSLDVSLPDGINLYGYIRSWIGLGQGARLLCGAMEAVGIPYMGIDVPTGSSTIKTGDTPFDDRLGKKPVYNISLIAVTPDAGFEILLMKDPHMLSGRYAIGYWMFELEELPKDWISNFPLVNEIWTPSSYTTETFSKYAKDIPVYTLPYGIDTPVNPTKTRADFGLPEETFLVLTMFDSGSVSARKNPFDAVKAFQMAFSKEDQAALVLKINNPNEEDIGNIRELMAENPNILFIDQRFSQEDVNALISLCNIYISLHRSEGFGLPVAEAMNLGTVVIATDYSATRDFVQAETGCPVSYTLVDVGKTLGECSGSVYKPGNLWAQPNVEEAAAYLKKLYHDPEYYDKLRVNALEFMKSHYSLQLCAGRIQARMEEIYRNFPKSDAQKDG